MIDEFVNYLEHKHIKYTRSKVNTDQVIDIDFSNAESKITVGFDSKGSCSDLTLLPSFFKLANTTEGWTSRDLLLMVESLIEGSYDVTLKKNLLGFKKLAILNINIKGKNLVGKSRVNSTQAAALAHKDLFNKTT